MFNPQPKRGIKKRVSCRVVGCETRAKEGKYYCGMHDKALSSRKQKERNKTKKGKSNSNSINHRNEAKKSAQRFARLEDADKNGVCICITCGKRTIWNVNTDGGHYINARVNATCFDIRNINAQCKPCNMSRMDDIDILETYIRNLDKKYGKGTAQRLKFDSQKTRKFSVFDYKLIKETYDKKFLELHLEKFKKEYKGTL